MADYRLYFLNPEGRIRHAMELQCTDDSEAEALALEHADGHDVELWCGARLVARHAGDAGG